jgi:hypothetical protein
LIALVFDKTNKTLLKNNSKYFKEIPAGIDQGQLALMHQEC